MTAVACSYDRYVQNWISLASYKQFSCENFFKIVMYLSEIPSVSICSGGPAVLTVKCQHRFNLQQIHRDTYWRLSSLYYYILHIYYSPRFVNFPINFNHNWWEFPHCLPLGDDRSQSHYATKNQYSKQNLWEFSIWGRGQKILMIARNINGPCADPAP